jgi:hypothetical protein
LIEEEEMPVSGGGSWKRSGELLFALLKEKQERHFEAGKLELAEEKSRGYERLLGLQDEYVKSLEWSDAEKAKKIEVLEKEKEELEKKYQDVLDDNRKDFEWMHQEVNKNQNGFLTCWEHYLDLLHLCNGKFMDNREPINHTKLLHNNGTVIILKTLSEHLSASSACARRGWWPGTRTGFTPPWDSAPVSVGGVWVGGWSGCGCSGAGSGGSKSPVMGPKPSKFILHTPRGQISCSWR